MRNLKRTLSLVMAAAMLIAMMVVSASAASSTDFTDADEIEHTEAVNTMVALNVIDGKEDGSYYDPTGTLTRAEMAKIVAFVMNGGVEPNIGTKLVPTYSDIDNHWAEAYIEYCTSMGIINGDGAGKFNPNGTLTASQTAKMFLTAMGYNAEVFGLVGNDWETNTNRYANEAGLYEDLGNVGVSDPISRDAAAQMAYNAIQATLMERTWSQNQTTGQITEGYELSKNGKTLLSERFGGKIFIGTFDGNHETNESGTREGEIAVTGYLTTDTIITSGIDKTYPRTAILPSDLDISNIGEEVKVIFKDGTSGRSGTPDRNDTIYGVFTSMALPFVLFPSAITNSMAVLLLPCAAQARAQQNERRIGAMVSMSLRYSCYMGILCIGLFTLFGGQLGESVFHDPDAGFFIAALSWLCPFMYLASTMGSILNGLGRTSATFLLNVAAMVIRLAFVVFAIPSFGILGYLWGMLASELVLAFLCCLLVRRLAAFSWDGVNMLVKPALLLILSIGLYLAIPERIRLSPAVPEFLTAVFGMGVISLCYGGLLLLFHQRRPPADTL